MRWLRGAEQALRLNVPAGARERRMARGDERSKLCHRGDTHKAGGGPTREIRQLEELAKRNVF